MAVRKSWSREEVTIALGLYAVTPASKISGKNKAIQELAKLLGRSPGSVSYKLQTFLSWTNTGREDQKVLATTARPMKR